jgi:hypothetical protein
VIHLGARHLRVHHIAVPVGDDADDFKLALWCGLARGRFVSRQVAQPPPERVPPAEHAVDEPPVHDHGIRVGVAQRSTRKEPHIERAEKIDGYMVDP